jgi:hypothetical protein
MTDIINTKNEFMTTVKNIIKQYGFTENDNGYEKISEQRTGGQILSINGQRMEQPGKIVVIKHIINFFEDGWVANEDESCKREFTQIKFDILQDNQNIGTYEDCFYWDDINYFENILKQIIR